MIQIRRALISVSDKTGLVELARTLQKFGVEILSTGGTAKLLRENKIAVKDVSEHTGFPEILDGRVKTLHPKVHGGLLALRTDQKHMNTVKELGIGLIDMVVINLYPFEQTVAKKGVSLEEAIENIDIGGPSMLRSAAKNAQSVAVVSCPGQYAAVIKEMEARGGSLSEETTRALGREVFKRTAAYDSAIYSYLSAQQGKLQEGQSSYPDNLKLDFVKVQGLRYGENPHQKAAFYKSAAASEGLVNLTQFQGKELSFNNILDLHSAWELVKEFDHPAAVIIKHNNPCGVAEATTLIKAYKDALACDPLSAFGGIVGLNRTVDAKTAQVIVKSVFLECIIAPAYEKDAVALFGAKKNLRVIELKDTAKRKEYDLKHVSGGLLVQDTDLETFDQEKLKTVTAVKPTKKELETLAFAWKVAKHVKSNAIVFARGRRTVGIGAGQTSRVDSVIIAKNRAGKNASGACLASDGFFPKPDSIAQAKKAGIRAIIQPGGSIADKEIIAACDKHKIPMVFTGIRHFKH